MNADTGIIVLLSSTYAPMLVVLCFSLRRIANCGLPVCMISLRTESRRSEMIAKAIASDSRLDVAFSGTLRVGRDYEKHDPFLSKVFLPLLSPFKRTVYFDSDMVVLKSIDELIASPASLVLTQFSDWTVNHSQVRDAVSHWHDVDTARVSAVLTGNWPCINTGTIAFTAGSPALPTWRDLTIRGAHHAATDEIAMQLLLPELVEAGHAACLSDDFNCSATAGVSQDPSILHFHGSDRRTTAKWHDVFIPMLREVYEDDWGNIRNWAPTIDDPDLHAIARAAS